MVCCGSLTDTPTILKCAISGRTVIAGEHGYGTIMWNWKGSVKPSRSRVHKRRVTGCALTGTGDLAVFTSGDATVSIWDLSAHRAAISRAHRGAITSCAATRDGQLICTGSNDGTVKIWNSQTGKALREFDKHEAGVFSCDISSDGARAVSGSWDEYVRVWDVNKNKLVKRVEEHLEVVTCCSISPDGKFAATGAPDAKLAIIRLQDGTVLEYENTGRDVRTCKFLPDGERIIAAGDTLMTLWRWRLGKLERVRDFDLGESIEHGEILCCEYLALSDQAVVGVSNGRIRLWQLKERADSRSADREWLAHADDVNALAVTSDGRYLLSCSDDETVKAWGVKAFRLKETLQGVVAFKSVCSASRIICAGDDLGNLWIFDSNL